MKKLFLLPLITAATISLSTATGFDGPKVGDRIIGDFNGDGIAEYAYSIKVKEGEGNPVEDGTSDEYEINFSNEKIGPKPVGCCGFILVSEGDLNNDGADEITVFQSPMNGCTKSVRTLTYSKGEWKDLFDPFMFSVGCGVEITDDELLKWVTLENGSVYYREPDSNDENLLSPDGDKIVFSRLVKTKAVLK